MRPPPSEFQSATSVASGASSIPSCEQRWDLRQELAGQEAEGADSRTQSHSGLGVRKDAPYACAQSGIALRGKAGDRASQHVARARGGEPRIFEAVGMRLSVRFSDVGATAFQYHDTSESNGNLRCDRLGVRR